MKFLSLFKCLKGVEMFKCVKVFCLLKHVLFLKNVISAFKNLILCAIFLFEFLVFKNVICAILKWSQSSCRQTCQGQGRDPVSKTQSTSEAISDNFDLANCNQERSQISNMIEF